VLEAADTSSEAAFNSEVFGSGTEPEDAASSPDGVPSLQPEVPAPSPERAASLQPEQAAASAPREGAAPSPQSSGSAPSVDWPPEEDRRIIALRIVSVSPERFSGRAIRTALAAEGFVHGKFSIFHKPDAQHRAVLSAASLSKPGMFDLETIDSQRFAGLNLFAVLSGSQPAREPFEMLLACARNLNERLEGGLQDDRGGPLTPSRIAVLRQSLGAAPAPLS
jgi:cell division protein ZipA